LIALLELSQTDHAALKASGRNFICSECPDRTKKLRRCEEDREDFNENDAIIFPIEINKGGEKYGFCPGKATWNNETVRLFRIMSLAAESNDWRYIDGGMVDQPAWWMDNINWFIPAYKQNQFLSRAKMILGDGTKNQTGVAKNGSNRKPSR
jgi:hypothetical protein